MRVPRKPLLVAGHSISGVALTCLLAQAQELQIRVPAAVSAEQAVCRRLRGGLEVGRQRGAVIRFPCADVSDKVSCDAPGLEPLDASVAELCKVRSTTLRIGRAVEIISEPAMDAEIEWLAFPLSAKMKVVARRHVSATGKTTIVVSEDSDRFVRFLRNESSPITVHGPEIRLNDVWSLPRPTPGGEIVARIEPAAIEPTAYEFTGAPMPEMRPTRHNLIVHGLIPAAYELKPLYQGGLPGNAVALQVQPADSAFIVLKKQSVGGVELKGDEGLCDSATELRLHRIGRSGDLTSGGVRDQILQTSDIAACAWTLQGLAAGTYDATVIGPSGLRGREEFSVAPQSVTHVLVRGADAIVLGEVLVNGAPLGNAHLRFQKLDGFEDAEVTTDQFGAFSVTLRSGDYIAVLNGDGLAQTSRQFSFRQHENRIRWVLAGGSVTVNVDASRGIGPTTVELAAKGGQWTSDTLDSPSGVVRFDGLQYGEYEVFAHQNGSASPRVSVRLHSEAPKASVSLVLEVNSSKIALRDETGNPVRGATFYSSSPMLRVAETEPGVYSLANVAPDTPVRIRSGATFVPTCKVVPGDTVVDVVVQRGRRVVLHGIKTGVLTIDSGSLIGTQGADCPVPLSDFESTPLANTGGAWQFVIRNFPRTDGVGLSLLTTSGRRQLATTEDRVLITPPF